MNLAKHEIVLRRGKPILCELQSGPPMDLPKGFTWKDGVAWEGVETVIDRNHKGELQPQVARVSKIDSLKDHDVEF